MCDCVSYIDKILKAVDDDLEKLLKQEGYVDAQNTVQYINSLEDKIALLLKTESKYYQDSIDTELEEEVVIARLQMLMNDDPMDGEAKKLFQSFFAPVLPAFTIAYLDKLKQNVEILSDTGIETEFLDTWCPQIGGMLKTTTHDAIELMLKDAFEHNKDLKEAIAQLQDIYEFSEERARRVAITEVLRAHSYSQYQAYMQCPSITKVYWCHNGAKDPRPHHVAMDGVTINKGDKFTIVAPSGVYLARFPRDITLPASESVFCHCTVEALVDESVLQE